MEKLICFQIENTREIERLASNMKIRVIKANAAIYNETLDNIVNGKIKFCLIALLCLYFSFSCR